MRLQEDLPLPNFSDLIPEQKNLYIQQINKERREHNYSKIKYSGNTQKNILEYC